MKLLKLKLEEKYRSLEPFEQTFPTHQLINKPVKEEIDPICLVGLNGCGKSNLLELIADIFYLLDTKYLSYGTTAYNPYADNKNEIYFEIEYFLHSKDKKVKISRLKNSKKVGFYTIDKNDVSTEIIKNHRDYLPKVISYTSGFNELLSMPSIELQDLYSKEVTRIALKVTKKEQKKLPSIDDPKLIFIDNNINEIIVITNFLMLESKILDVFKEHLKIDSIDSFRIVFEPLKIKASKALEIPLEMEEFLEALKKTSTCYDYNSSSKKYTFDYFINKESRDAFNNIFKTPENLFNTLYKLNLLNHLSIEQKYTKPIRNQRKNNGKLVKFPEISPIEKIFRIENLLLKINKPVVISEYIRISDGEHQFLQIFGAIFLFGFSKFQKDILYLLDEPDTHFNPEWRRKFFSILNKKVGYIDQEIIITTHSPFILSDCHGYKVFQFSRNGDSVTFKRSEYETYGSSVSFILENIFNFHHPQISDSSLGEIEGLKKVNDVEELKKQVRLYGESTEKLLILKQIYDLEEGKIKN